ncbi:hypothetical protein HC766_09605 [Candidatus Gracilibacteria bacterium]|nr:hypothetical protein [Candidatus Gracilibacteria bacterium]
MLRLKISIIQVLITKRHYLILILILYYVGYITSVTILKESIGFTKPKHLYFVILPSVIFFDFLFQLIYNDLLGGNASLRVTVFDPESLFLIVGSIPVLGPPIILFRIHQKLNQLKREMKKQGVSQLEYFKPLPRKLNRHL